MKKLMFIIGLLAAAAAYAQTPQDSTVNIVAYWNAGEKYAYEYSEEEFTIENGDTTEVYYSNAIQIYEILEQTESSYKISVTYKDEFSSDPMSNSLNAVLEERYGDPKIIITTDQYGSLQSIENLQELSEQIISVLDEVIDIMMKNDDQSPDAEEQKTYIKDYLKQMFSNQETLKAIFAEDITRALYFHGCAFDLDQEYTGQIGVPSIFPGIDQQIPANVTLWADSEYTDEYSTVCRSQVSISEEDFRNFVSDYAISTINNASEAGLDEESKQAAIAEVEKALSALKGTMNEYLTVEIHSTGWPLTVFYDKIVHVTMEDKDQEKNTSMSLKMIIPNDEE